MDVFETYISKNKCNPECRALTYKSYGEVYKRAHHKELEPVQHNYELATYGDALLKFALCTLLLDKFEQLSKEKEKYETDKFLIETVAKHYRLLDYMNFDTEDKKILQKYKYHKKKTKYIATTVEAALGALYKDEKKSFPEICELVESWMKLI